MSVCAYTLNRVVQHISASHADQGSPHRKDRGAPAVSTAAPMGRVSTAEAVSSRWARVKGSFPATRPAVSPPSMEPTPMAASTKAVVLVGKPQVQLYQERQPHRQHGGKEQVEPCRKRAVSAAGAAAAGKTGLPPNSERTN